MARRRTNAAEGIAALEAWARGSATSAQVRTAVRFTLAELADVAPGNSVEVRVPPAGVVQVLEGPRHTRGTPPNTVEMTPEVWLRLATGLDAWEDQLAAGRVHASGTRADLAALLPLPAAATAVSGIAGADGIASTS